jgi:hypothetical protein
MVISQIPQMAFSICQKDVVAQLSTSDCIAASVTNQTSTTPPVSFSLALHPRVLFDLTLAASSDPTGGVDIAQVLTSSIMQAVSLPNSSFVHVWASGNQYKVQVRPFVQFKVQQ